MFATGKFAICFDLVNENEIFRTESEGYYSASIQNEPLVFKHKKVVLNNQEITTYDIADENT